MAKFNFDGWGNILAGISKRTAKNKNTIVENPGLITDDELSSIWTGEGVGAKIVSTKPGDATREWISINGDEKNVLANALNKLDAKSKFNEALTWARLFGGSCILLGVQDGKELEEPFVNSKGSEVMWLKVYERPRIKAVLNSVITNSKSPFYEEYEFWDLTRTDGIATRVHRSRLLMFKGIPIPRYSPNITSEIKFWGMSVIQQVYSNLTNFGGAYEGISNLLLEHSIGVFKVEGLANLLASNKTDAIYNRLQAINDSKSMINGILIGENEDFRRDTAGLGGIPETLDLYMTIIAGVSDYPVTKLFGKSPAGMNATGEGDIRNYYDSVKAYQENKIQNPISILVNVLNMNFSAVAKENLSISFNPIWNPSQKEITEMRKTQSDTDKIYIDTGVLTSEEIRKSRFENGYNFTTHLEE